jgi:hypothetical protein
MTQYKRLTIKPDYDLITYSQKYILLFLSAVLLSSIFFSSCNPQKKIIKAPIKEEGADYLFGKLKQNELKFEWFTSKFSANYKNKGESNSFDGQIRIHRDSVIWMSFTTLLGIEVLRIFITQDSVKFINRLNSTYFTGDYNYVNKFLNTNIDFDILQSFMIGNDLSFYEDGKFKASLDGGEYKLSTAERMKLKKFVRNSQEQLKVLIQNIWIDPVTFKITRADVKEIRKPNLKLEARYSDFEKVADQFFPKEVKFDIYADNNIDVNVEFKKIMIDTPQSFPFKIPLSYRQLK